MVKTINGEDEGNRSVTVEISPARGRSSSSTKDKLRSTRGRQPMQYKRRVIVPGGAVQTKVEGSTEDDGKIENSTRYSK